MAIRTKSGMTIDTATMADLDKLLNHDFQLLFNIRKNKVLVEEKITILPSRLAIAMIHREMDSEARANAIASLQPEREYRIVSVGSDLKDEFKVDSEPVLDWENAMSMKRLDLKENPTTLMAVSATFAALPYNLRTKLISENKEMVIYEYLLVSDFSILGTY